LTLADESRIIDIFLSKPSQSDSERNKKRVSAFYEAEKLGADLFSYMNQNRIVKQRNTKSHQK
jgi:hypothetical protein